jgi:hypothetical protein
MALSHTDLIAVALIGGGAYLAWFGVHYWRTDTAWPSAPIKAVLTGNAIPAATKEGLPNLPAGAAAGVGSTGIAVGGLSGAGMLAPTAIGGTYDGASLRALWTASGGDPGAAAVAAAVALAESSGRPGATSANPDGGTNVGLWQLDTRGVGSGYSVTQLSDPSTNARVTVMGSHNGTNWSPWQTYVEGTYKKFLGS